MTNNEAIRRLKYAHFHFRNEINEVEIKSVCGTDELKEFDLAISALEENDKLKSEIESVKYDLRVSNKLINEQLEVLLSYKAEIKRLKTELEQSVK